MVGCSFYSISFEKWISLETLNTLNTDLQSILQNTNKFTAGAKQSLFSLIPEAAVHMNFAVNFARFFRTPILYNIDNHMQSRCSKKSCKTHGKMLVLKSLFNKTVDLRLAILLNWHFSRGVFLWILKNILEQLFYRTPLDDCLSNTVQILLHYTFLDLAFSKYLLNELFLQILCWSFKSTFFCSSCKISLLLAKL